MYRVGLSTAYAIIPEVCKAIWEILQPKYMKFPSNQNDWLQISEGFHSRLNFPHCIGAVDGKHIKIKAPPNSGSAYHNYKNSFSIVLMAICDSNYKFTWVDIGDFGKTVLTFLFFYLYAAYSLIY